MFPSDWQYQWQQSIRTVAGLLEAVELTSEQCPDLLEQPDFPLRVPLSYIKRICKGNPDDPLLKQILPLKAEQIIAAGYSNDPVNDQSAIIGKGILQKYQGRVLLLVNSVCAIHCRYCFRKNFPYENNILSNNFDNMIEYIRGDNSLEEVILSGGDPLSLSNARLFELCQQLENIPHIRRLRIHTRLPISLPARLDQQMSSWLNDREIPYIIVFHVNHPNEINEEVIAAIRQLHRPTLLNQAVLLKGVNDNADTLIDLSRACFNAGILPYYLHLLDKVHGTAHFEVNTATAKSLMNTVQAALPGYLVPKLVQEIPGESAKRLV